ncbi:MAG: low affinity iron permease family protein [Aeromicrobium sp.]
MTAAKERMPSSVSKDLDLFDRFATKIGHLVSRAPFFAAAVLIVAAWLVEGGVRMAVAGPHAFLSQSYQLQINTVTTVVTFLLVALLQNTQARDNEALQEKLNAIADGLSHLMDSAEIDDPDGKLRDATTELRDAVGLEQIVGADDQSAD